MCLLIILVCKNIKYAHLLFYIYFINNKLIHKYIPGPYDTLHSIIINEAFKINLGISYMYQNNEL